MMSLRLPRPVPVQAIAALLTFGLIATSLVTGSATANSVYAFAGDWTGNGKSAPGWYVDGVFHLQGAGPDGGDLLFAYGRPGDHPVFGDWNGDGIDTVGIVRNGRDWHLRKTNTGGPGEAVFTYGSRWRTERPVVGDWNGNGFDTVGVVRGSTWLLRNSLSGGEADLSFTFGRVHRGDLPMAADWNGDNRDTPGVVRDGVWYVSNEARGGSADQKFVYGRSSDTPIAGNWDGKGGHTPGVVRGTTWFLKDSLSGGVADTTVTFAGGVEDAQKVDATDQPTEPGPVEPASELVGAQDKALDEPDDLPSEETAVPAPDPETKAKADAEPDELPSEEKIAPAPDPETKAKADAEPEEAEEQVDSETQPAATSTAVTHGVGLRRSDVGLPSGWSGVRSGQVRSTRDGQVIEDLHVAYSSGGSSEAAIHVVHDNVTIRNVRVEADGPAAGIRVHPGVRGTVIENCHIDGMSPSYGTGRSDGNYGNPGIWLESPSTVQRCYLTGVRSGIRLRAAGSTVVENWIDELHRNAPGVSTSAINFRGSSDTNPAQTLVARNRVVAGSSAGLNMYPTSGPVRNVRYVDNLVIGVGLGFGIRGGRSHQTSTPYWHLNRDIRIEGNRFQGHFAYPSVLGEGTNASIDLERPGNTFVNNRWVGQSTDLPARCGTRQNACEDLP